MSQKLTRFSYAWKLVISVFALTVLISVNVFAYTERVSLSSLGVAGNGTSAYPSVSSDGRYVAFDSTSTNLVPGDSNGVSDVFVYDRDTNTIERVSVTSLGVQANGSSVFPTMSADGRYVAFTSLANNLVAGDTNTAADAFVYDRDTDTIERVSIATGGAEAEIGIVGSSTGGQISMSADGRYVAFASESTNLVPGDANAVVDLFLHDRDSDTTERVIEHVFPGVLDDGHSFFVSATGRYIVSATQNPYLPEDTNSLPDIYIYDRDTVTYERVSVSDLGAETNDFSYAPSVSSDGRYVTFTSDATNLVSGDTNGFRDAFVYDRNTDTVERVNVSSVGTQANNASLPPYISSNGEFIVFGSSATNLVSDDTNGFRDVFVYEISDGSVERVNVSSAYDQATGHSASYNISSTGKYVVFNGVIDGDGGVFLFDFNDPPTDIVTTPLSMTFYENQPIGTAVATLDTTDLDVSDTHTYSIACDSPGSHDASLAIDGDTLESAEIYDYEIQDQYEVCVVTNDGNGGTFEEYLYVDILDAVPTDIVLSNSSINENNVLNATIGTLSTVTTDTGDIFTYSLACTAPAADDVSFSISGNSLLAGATFDFETKSSYAICIRTDSLGRTYDENFTITINDVNENTTGSGGGGGSDDDEEENDDPITGCMDPLAVNHNPAATTEGGICVYPAIYYGCTDTSANNFDDDAIINDGSCEYDVPVVGPNVSGCMDPGASNYDAAATIEDGSCAYIDTPIVTDPPIGGGGGGAGPTGGGGGSSSGGSLDPKDILEVAVPAGIAVPLIVMLLRDPGIVASLLSIPVRVATLIPTLMGYRRRKRPWGTVYDSVTKQPLDPVYVTLLGVDGAEVGTSITDIDGRYGFLVSPGTYRISSNKADYVFPSQKLSGKTSDELYDNLYFGGDVTVENKDTIINKNIPMDALKFNWNEFEKAKNKRLMRFYSSLDLFFARISKILFAAGLVSTVTLSIVAPSTIHYVFLGIYCAIIVLHIFGIKPKSGGYVFERANGFPMSFGIVRVFSAELGREIAHTVIGKTGKYFMLVPKGKYYMKIQKKTGEDSYVDIYTSDAFKARNGYIDKVVRI